MHMGDTASKPAASDLAAIGQHSIALGPRAPSAATMSDCLHYNYEPIPFAFVDDLPRDDDGYVRAFDISQTEEISEFFETYGVVVVKDVATAAECEQTIDEIWSDIGRLTGGTARRNAPSTWQHAWPTGGAGILGNDVARGPMAFHNRQNEKIAKLFALLMLKDASATEQLLSSVDRFGVMRPTTGIVMDENAGKARDMPEWRGPSAWFHWDLNPHVTTRTLPASLSWEECKQKDLALQDTTYDAGTFICENNSAFVDTYAKMQGLLVLEDSTADSGGFQVVPSFHTFLQRWAECNDMQSLTGFVRVPRDDPMWRRPPEEEAHHTGKQGHGHGRGIKVTARRGSFVLWSSKLPHCNYPNESRRWRYCQYIKCIPRDSVAHYRARRRAMAAMLGSTPPESPLGKALLGLT